MMQGSWIAHLVNTLAWSLGIGCAAAVLAWPMAWWLRRAPARAAIWVCTPLLVPNYLAYAGWGLLRAPGSWLGDRLEAAAQGGARWAPVFTGQALAFVGLALWCAPIAAIVVSIRLRSIDGSVIESLRLDTPSLFGRARALVSMCWGSLVAAIALVALLMTGSAIPLHLAQVQTFAIDVWFNLDNTPPADHWKVWLSAWPLVLIAMVGGWFVGGRAGRVDPGASSITLERRSGLGGSAAGSLLVLAAGVGVPLVLFATHLGSWRSMRGFWVLNWRAVQQSAGVAAVVCAIGSSAALLIAWGMSGSEWRAGIIRNVVRALVVVGLLPGVLVGSAVGRSLGRIDWLADSWLIVVAAHVLRFAFVPALVGCWLAKQEPGAERDLRWLEGGDSFAGWLRSVAVPAWGPLVGAGLATGLLSLHEIESAVQVMPPGESLPRQILQFLHYSRLEEMSAAALWLVGGGVILAGLSVILIRPLILPRTAGTVKP